MQAVETATAQAIATSLAAVTKASAIHRPIPTTLQCAQLNVFDRDASVFFEWVWAGSLNGDFLEIRIGPPGNIRSLDIVPQSSQVEEGIWQLSIPASAFYTEDSAEYRWQVAYVAADQQTILSLSETGCFRIE